MSCDRWVEAISAMADGEDPGVDPRLVEAHVARCASCQRFRADVDANRLRARISEAAPVPDLSRRIVKLNAIADRAARWGAVRGLLAISAVQIIVLSAPALVWGTESGASPHDARHLGALNVAYAIGLLAVAARPARARTMLPVAAVLGAALVLSAAVDVVDGTTGAIGEVVHLPTLGSVALIWLLARPPSRRSPDSRHRAVLRAVDPDGHRRDEAG